MKARRQRGQIGSGAQVARAPAELIMLDIWMPIWTVWRREAFAGLVRTRSQMIRSWFDRDGGKSPQARSEAYIEKRCRSKRHSR